MATPQARTQPISVRIDMRRMVVPPSMRLRGDLGQMGEGNRLIPGPSVASDGRRLLTPCLAVAHYLVERFGQERTVTERSVPIQFRQRVEPNKGSVASLEVHPREFKAGPAIVDHVAQSLN